MKAYLVVCLLLILNNSILFPQWTWLNPKPQGNHLFTIQFINDQIGWAAGDFGTMLKTTDFGLNWTFSRAPTDMFIYDIHFLDKNLGWAVCHGGVILHTENGGESWIQQDSGRSEWLFSVCFIDQNKGWAVGHGNNIFYTTNGGLNWNFFQLGNINEYSRVYFYNSQIGWLLPVSYSPSLMYRTSDGGNNWEPIVTPIGGLWSVFFISEQIGYGIGTSSIFKTTDSGYSWNLLLSTGQDNFYSIKFTDEQHGWVIGSFGRILYTNNSGESWRPLEINTERWLYDIEILSNGNAYGVGEMGTMLKSSDYGRHWELFCEERVHFFSDIHFINESTGWLVGYFDNADVFKTTDGGLSWVSQLTTDGGPEAVFFNDEDFGWFVGGNKIWLTQDGGENWKKDFLPDHYFYDVDFVSREVGFIAGSSGSIYKSTNFGTGWTRLLTNVEFNFRAIHFSDENNGWAVGESHIALKTNDGGVSWRKIFEWPGPYFFDVFFLNPSVGWIVGDSVIIKTTNGGQDWVEQYVNSEDFIMAVHFVDENYGWVSGRRILNTTDGGNSWNVASELTPNGITDIHFFNKEKGIAVGSNGTILLGDYTVSSINEESISDPQDYSLFQNYPNPFNPKTKIRFSIPNYSTVTIKVFDVLGNEVCTLLNSDKPAGQYEIEFNGETLTSGIYFFRMIAGNYLETRKMILLK